MLTSKKLSFPQDVAGVALKAEPEQKTLIKKYDPRDQDFRTEE